MISYYSENNKNKHCLQWLLCPLQMHSFYENDGKLLSIITMIGSLTCDSAFKSDDGFEQSAPFY